MKRNRIENLPALLLVMLAVAFWYVTFVLKIFNFWLSMGMAATMLSALSILIGGPPFRKEEVNRRAVVFGALSAVILYLLFWTGFKLSGFLFDFAGPQVNSVYELRSEGTAGLISLLLFFVTSPGEEIFWRGFLQRWLTQGFGDFRGWLLSSAVYAAVHIPSGNIMLVLAALVAGLYWGLIYWKKRSIVPAIISHALWTVSIFVLFPIS